MAIKSDRWIQRMALEHGMIAPFVERQVRQNVISFGLSSYGYDVRLSNQFKIYRPPAGAVVDPKNADINHFEDHTGQDCIVGPNSLVLARTLERFKIPRNVLTICVGKSTYARCGVLVNVTPFEPEWEGYATLQITNISGSAVRLYAGEGIAQVVFFESDESCMVSYQDKLGKYQNQKQEITMPRV